MFKGKKGDARTEPVHILGLEILPGVFFLILFLILIGLLIILFFNFTSINCDNSAEWKEIEDIASKLDSVNKGEVDMQFYNKGCYLVGFSDPSVNQQLGVTRGRNVGITPELCLCKLDGIKCDAYKCIELKDIETIKDKKGNQFISTQYPVYTNFNFKKDDSTLLIDSEYAQEISLNYKHSPNYASLDQGLIDSMSITVLTNVNFVFTGFIPVVAIKSQQLLPEAVPHNTIFFDLSIRETAGMQDATISSFIQDAKEYPKESIKEISFQFILTKEILQEYNLEAPLKLYFLKDSTWMVIDLNCEKEIAGLGSKDEDYAGQESPGYETGNLLCKATINYYPSELAIGG